MKYDWLSSTKVFRVGICGVILGTLGAGTLTGCTTIPGIQQGKVYGIPATDRTIAQRVLDQSIKNTIYLNMQSLEPALAQTGRVSVHSFHSYVLLTGEVPDDSTKYRLESTIASMPDVKDVHSYLKVMPKRGVNLTLNDRVISSKIKAKIATSGVVRLPQVQVVTDAGEVYVLGKLTPVQRDYVLNMIDSTAGVRKKFMLAEMVDDYGAVISTSSGNTSMQANVSPSVAVNAGYSNNAGYTTNTNNSNLNYNGATPNVSVPNNTSGNNYTQNIPYPNSEHISRGYIEMYKNEMQGR